MSPRPQVAPSPGSPLLGRTVSLCPAACLASPGLQRANVTAVQLSGGPLVSSVKVRLLDREAGRELPGLVSGYRADYQPVTLLCRHRPCAAQVRQLVPPVSLELGRTSLVLECEGPGPCSATLTLAPGPGVISCGSRPDTPTTVETSCVRQGQVSIRKPSPCQPPPSPLPRPP